jgi:ribonucleotide monophosphatase NagD (HAD superfamily)
LYFNISGPFVTALEYATERTAEIVGKPQPTFFLSSVEEFNCKPEECLMIGDVSAYLSKLID